MYYNSVLPGLLITRCWKVYVSTGITISRRGTLIIKGHLYLSLTQVVDGYRANHEKEQKQKL